MGAERGGPLVRRHVPQPLALAALALTTAACGLVLGFEDHEPFPDDGGGGNTGGSGPGGAGGAGAMGGGGAGPSGIDVLLITDPSSDSVGVYDPMDGTYLGDFVPPPTGAEPYELGTPNNAIQGPDGRIYVSDQIRDVVLRFEADGTFESIWADTITYPGLDNVRGMQFRGEQLFVSVSPGSSTEQPKAVALFDIDGNYLGNFVETTTGAFNPFDVLFTAAGTMLMANIQDPDDIRLYDVDGSSFEELIDINFPQQIQPLADGTYVVAAWTEVTQFTIDGTVVRSLTDLSSCSGVFPLDDGQWLITSNDGVQSINPFSMQVIDTKRVGSSFLKIERVTLPEETVMGLGG